MHLGRVLATILTMMTMVATRVATHGVAALDRLLGRSDANTVESIHRKSDGQ
jgi:hypothetical protein